ncbi:MAG: PP2C family protein-serine/threonine phosphatase, partial [Chitinophagales bacterium]
MITKKQVDTNLSKEELLQMLAVKQNQINSLLEVTKAVNNNYSKHAIFRIFEFILRAQFDVNKILLFSRTAKDGEWVCGMEHNAEDAIQKINVERDLERFQFIQKITNFPFEGFENFDLLIPISHKKEPLAYLLLGCPLFEGEIETANDQVKLIETLANIIVVSLENKRLFKRQLEQSQLKKEMDLAAEVQQLLIPTKLDISPSIEAYGHYEPHGEIGGDYYDYLQYSDHEYALCICDVSGKGLSAGMLMSNFQANLRALISREYPLEQIVD